MMMNRLRPQPLTVEAFTPFGDVIETGSASSFAVNDDLAQRYDDLAFIDTADQDGRPNISIFVSEPRPLPVVIDMIECHPLGSQMFVPLGDHPYLVAVSNGAPPFEASDLSVFLISDGRGVNYRKGLWHLPLCPLYRPGRFLVVDRGGPGDNCDEFHFPSDARITVELDQPH
jgi:ureidoglycolate lyase